MTLFPEVEAGAYVERILAETVDINEDGEYTERSTGVYNAVCNRSLRFISSAPSPDRESGKRRTRSSRWPTA